VQGGGTLSEGTLGFLKNSHRNTFNEHLQINNGTINNTLMK